MDSQNKTIQSYIKRAQLYETKTSWVTQKECIEPITPSPFGTNKALDVCAGTGAISKALISKGWVVTSMDISKDMLAQSGLNNILIGDMHSVPLPDKSVDLVVCRQGLQYSDLIIAIKEFVRVSKKRVILGHITSEENDTYSFWKEYFEIASPGRIHVFKPNEIKGIIESLGYKPQYLSVFRQQDYYMGPIIHLSSDIQKQLVTLLLNQPDSFKALYNVRIFEGSNITYSNRWEFIQFDI